MPREFSRHLRVGSELQRVLNDLLHSEVKDPRLHNVRISSIELSADLGVARAYFSTLNPDADIEPVEKALEKALGFLRRRIGRELRNHYDEAVRLSGRSYVDNMIKGLQHWVDGADNGYLAWGIMDFRLTP